MLGRVENQGRVKNSEAERRKNLNEEERGRSLRSRGEERLTRIHRSLVVARCVGRCQAVLTAGPASSKRRWQPPGEERGDFGGIGSRFFVESCLFCCRNSIRSYRA